MWFHRYQKQKANIKQKSLKDIQKYVFTTCKSLILIKCHKENDQGLFWFAYKEKVLVMFIFIPYETEKDSA